MRAVGPHDRRRPSPGSRLKGLARNILRGASTVLVLSPAPRFFALGEGILERSDQEALYGDWVAVGHDMRAAIAEVVAEHQGGIRGARDDGEETQVSRG